MSRPVHSSGIAKISASIFTKDYKSVPVADQGWKEGEA